MLFDIINPSDPCTLEADQYVAAVAAVSLLGEGMYGLDPLDNEMPSVPVTIFAPDLPASVYDACGHGIRDAMGLMNWLNVSAANNEACAKALDSVRYGDAIDRDVPKEVGRARRSSMNDICQRAWKQAEALRGRRLFETIDQEHPIVNPPSTSPAAS